MLCILGTNRVEAAGCGRPYAGNTSPEVEEHPRSTREAPEEHTRITRYLLPTFRLAPRPSGHGGAHARRSRTAARMSATTSVFGLAPRLPLPWTRTLMALAAMSRGPTTNMVCTLASSACWILPLILSLL